MVENSYDMHVEPVTLLDATDDAFGWMLEAATPEWSGLKLPPGGVDRATTLQHVRAIADRLRQDGCNGAWMIIAQREVVGLCGYKAKPNNGEVEIGYGVTASRRNRGYATAAVKMILRKAAESGLEMIWAETEEHNRASHRALEKNGFVTCGSRVDSDDGPLLIWRAFVQ